jgi:TetR/AcrR family transcriptional regulator
VLFLLAEQICWSYPTSLPFYQLVLPGRDLTSPAAQASARQQIIDFIVGGLMLDPHS